MSEEEAGEGLAVFFFKNFGHESSMLEILQSLLFFASSCLWLLIGMARGFCLLARV